MEACQAEVRWVWCQADPLKGVIYRKNSVTPTANVRFCGKQIYVTIQSKEEGYLLYDLVKILERRYRKGAGSSNAKYVLNYPARSPNVNLDCILPEDFSGELSQNMKDLVLERAQQAAREFEQSISPEIRQNPPSKFEEYMGCLKQCPGIPQKPLQGCEGEYKLLQEENMALRELVMSLQKPVEDQVISNALNSTSKEFGRDRENEQSRPEELRLRHQEPQNDLPQSVDLRVPTNNKSECKDFQVERTITAPDERVDETEQAFSSVRNDGTEVQIGQMSAEDGSNIDVPNYRLQNDGTNVEMGRTVTQDGSNGDETIYTWEYDSLDQNISMQSVSEGLRSTPPRFGRERENEQSRPSILQNQSGMDMPTMEDSPNGGLRFLDTNPQTTGGRRKRKFVEDSVPEPHFQEPQNNSPQIVGDPVVGLHIPMDALSEVPWLWTDATNVRQTLQTMTPDKSNAVYPNGEEGKPDEGNYDIMEDDWFREFT